MVQKLAVNQNPIFFLTHECRLFFIAHTAIKFHKING